MVALSASRALRAVVVPRVAVILVAIIVAAAVVIVTAAVAVIIAPVFTMVIIAALVVSGAGSSFGFFGVGVSVCCLYHFTDGCGPLAVQLSMELLVLEPFGESGDGLGISNVGNRVSCL